MDNIQSFRYTKEEISNMFKDDLKNHYMKRSNNEIVSVGTAIENREENIPNNWVEIMKNSIITTGGKYSTQRMVIDYTNKMYMPLCNLYNT